MLLLLAGSVLVTAESRVAWEVTALGPLLAALLLALALRILKEAEPDRRPWLDATAFVVIATLGTYSHLIFLALVARTLRLEPGVRGPLPGLPNAFPAAGDDDGAGAMRRRWRS